MIRRLLVVLTVVAGGALVAAVPAVADQGANYAFTLEGTTGSSLATAPLVNDTGPTTTFTATATGTPADSLTVTAAGSVAPATTWTVQLTAPAGSSFVAQHDYPVAGTADAADAGFAISNGTASCATPSGRLELEQLVQAADGTVTSLAASYQVRCADTEPLVYGELRYGAVDDTAGTWSTYPAATRSPSAVDFGGVRQGASASRTITLTSAGTESLQPLAPTVTDDAGGAFAVSDNTCSDPLPAGSSCSVVVTVSPPTADTRSTRTAELVLPLGNDGGTSRVVPLSATELPDADGRFFPVRPVRLYDSRTQGGPVTSSAPRTVPVLGQVGLPAAGIAAVVLNVTAVNGSGGFVAVSPSGLPLPGTSSLNVGAGQIRANSVTAPVGDDGAIVLSTNMQSTNLVLDVTGYYGRSDLAVPATLPGSEFVATAPRRLYDSRTDPLGALTPRSTVELQFAFGSTVASDVTAVAVNVTAAVPTGIGYLAAWDGVGAAPGTSTVNFTAGSITPNLAVVPTTVNAAGYASIAVQNRSSGLVHVLVDVFGYYTANAAAPRGSLFHAVTPQRIADSRDGTGGLNAPLNAGGSAAVSASSDVSVSPNASAVVLNVTGVSPTQGTFLTVWPRGQTQPVVSNLNLTIGEIIPNAVMVGVDDEQRFSLYNLAGTMDVVADLSGYFIPSAGAGGAAGAPTPAVAPAAPSRRAG